MVVPQEDIRHLGISVVKNSNLFHRNGGLTGLKRGHFYSG